ncbi:MAG: PAS domain-containing sensor histidine kinase [Terriglobales bacterium]
MTRRLTIAPKPLRALPTDEQIPLLRAIRAAVIVTDLAGTITYWNPFAQELYGWSSSEVMGRPIMEITVSSDTEQQAKECMADLNAGKSWAGEFQVLCKDGKYLTALVSLSPMLDESGNNAGIIGVSQDLRSHKQAEDALRSSERQFHALADLLPELCWMAHGDGHIFWYNQTWYDYTGTTAEQMQGWGWQAVHDPSVLPAVLERWEASLRTGQDFEMEFPLRGVDGVFRWFLTRIKAVRNGDGKVVRWFGTNANIHEQREMRQSLLQASQELESRVQERTVALRVANRSLRELSARLLQIQDEERRRLARELHDSVGQLVVAIQMNIAVVQSTPLAPKAEKAVAENVGLLGQIGDEIRTISHLLHPPLLDEAGLASALRWYVQGFSERSGIAVELDVAGEIARLDNETEIAIFRVVQECLTNVHRHSGSRHAAVRIAREDGRVQVEIRDTGKGIPAEKLDAFSSSGRGGVGFRGMRERIAELGGLLEIQSDEHGTAVIAQVPARKPPLPGVSEA